MTTGCVYRTTAQVGPGHRIEIVAPEIAEGERMEVILLPLGHNPAPSFPTIDLLLSENRPVRDAAYWEERERELQESRDSWDR